MALPFRDSPTFKHTRLFSQSKRHTPKPLFTQTITPADSEDETSPPLGSISIVQQPQIPQFSMAWGQEVGEHLDAIMDMGSPKQTHAVRHFDTDAMMLSPNASPRSLLPYQVNNLAVHDVTNGGRLPTPIYGHFQQSMDAKMDCSSLILETGSPFDNEYENHMRARRLPTPISEDEAMDVFDSALPVQPKELSEIPCNQLRQPARFAPPLPYQSPKQGKPMFSMGFRADCDMCRNRVPGHYNHIFRP